MKVLIKETEEVKDIYLIHPRRGECSEWFLDNLIKKSEYSPVFYKFNDSEKETFEADYFMSSGMYDIVNELVRKTQEMLDGIEKDNVEDFFKGKGDLF